MRLKLLFTFLLLIVLQTIAFGQSFNVVKGEDFMEYGSGFIAVKLALNESKCPFTEIKESYFFRKRTFNSSN